MRGGDNWDMSSTAIQGGILPRPLGGYQANLMMEPNSPAPAWHHSIIKQEPIDQDRNDSGINSCSDFHSSSPGSDNSQDFNQIYHQTPNVPQSNATPYYTTPILSRGPSTSTTPFPQQNSINCNPLTPPTSEPLTSPKIQIQNLEDTNNFKQDHLSQLKMTLERNGLIPPSSPSPKPSDQSDEDVVDNEYDDQGIPKVNSHGKVKKFKCKQCDFIAITKLDFWEHTKGHIKADKMLTCPKCPFVTEYKHHLEYHLRNHFGSKPFKCDKCSYSCVNKSMLNSHMKSHSNIYQYRCSNCSYATKYCHSLKLHLRKYSHKPAMVLNPDGTPNPLPIIDVYGTRRGPKQKLQMAKEQEENQTVLPNPLAQLMMTNPPQLPLAFPYPFLSGFGLNNPLFFQNFNNNGQSDDDRSLSPQDDAKDETFEENKESQDDSSKEREEDWFKKQMNSLKHSENQNSGKEDSVLDLSKPLLPIKNRRKGKAIKLDKMALDGSDDEERDEDEEDDRNDTTMKEHEEDVGDEVSSVSGNNNNKLGDFSCQFCDIAFGDVVLYTMHMGYHGYKDPFTCNMCGEHCNDKVSFFLHIARTSHS